MQNMNSVRAATIKAYADIHGWTSGMVMMYALCTSQIGIFLKAYKNGQELRQYSIDSNTFKIRAFPCEHSY